MSTLQTTILKHPDSGSNNIQFDSSGRVGVGTASPSRPLEVNQNGEAFIRIISSDTGNAGIEFGDQSDSVQGAIFQNSSDNSLRFNGYNNTERFRIDSDGRMLLGLSTSSDTVAGTQSNLIIEANSSSNTSYGGLTLQRGTTSIGNNTSLGRIFFTAQDGRVGARISALGGGSWAVGSTPGQITFDTTPPNTTAVVNRMKIDENGAIAVGDPSDSSIGQVTSTVPFSVVDLDETGGGATLQLRGRSPKLFFDRTSSGNGEVHLDGADLLIMSGQPANPGTERFRIMSNGETTFDSNFTSIAAVVINNDSSGTGKMLEFQHGGSVVGSINNNNSITAYNTSSDYRLKENVVSVTDGITRLQQLKPSRFNFIADADRTVDGFLAHEVQTVVPEAITGEKDAVDEDGNAVMQGIDQSKLVPLLTAALQEAIAKIEALETKVAALEAG